MGCHINKVRTPYTHKFTFTQLINDKKKKNSRSGEPNWSTVTSSPSPPPWAHKVSWESADVFRPATYAPLLKGADYVVQSLGILLEADYKGVITGQKSPLAGLQSAFRPVRSANPLERDDDANNTTTSSDGPGGASGGGYPAPKGEHQLTYENMNRDSAILVARAADQQGARAFLYVSAAGGAPVLPARYITTKREAEAVIAAEFPRMRGVFLRPPFMYDSCRPVTIPMAAATAGGFLLNRLTAGVAGGFLGAAGAKPLRVDVVAEAAVEALSQDGVRGPVEVAQMEELATQAWRKAML